MARYMNQYSMDVEENSDVMWAKLRLKNKGIAFAKKLGAKRIRALILGY